MPKISELTSPYVRACIYGPSGSGKTRFPGTAKGSKYWFNFEENNIVTLLANGVEADYDNYDDKPDSKSSGYTRIIAKIVDLKKDCPYNVVVVDTGMGFYKAHFDHIMKLNNLEVARIQDWGLTGERVKNDLKEILRLPAHVFVIFHEQLEKDETFGRVMGRIAIPGKYLPDEIPGMFNMFLHFKVQAQAGKEPKRVVATTPDSLFPACDKYGALDPIEEPDFNKIWEKIERKLHDGWASGEKEEAII